MPNDGYDDMCVTVLENAQNAGLCDVSGKIFLYIIVARFYFILFYFK